MSACQTLVQLNYLPSSIVVDLKFALFCHLQSLLHSSSTSTNSLIVPHPVWLTVVDTATSKHKFCLLDQVGWSYSSQSFGIVLLEGIMCQLSVQGSLKTLIPTFFFLLLAGGDFSFFFFFLLFWNSITFGKRKMTFPCYAKSGLYRLQLVVASQKRNT